ncbi:MAG: hypothetical protein D6807_08630 [Alphaproteobacteria bacterium]|nr:MAG: hypothetical protein D6807_08630 [Alphaproteobacteria bacterium]
MHERHDNTLRHPWLPADDPANHPRQGYWVPTPQEIEEQVRVLRAQRIAHGTYEADFSPPLREVVGLAVCRRQGVE